MTAGVLLHAVAAHATVAAPAITVNPTNQTALALSKIILSVDATTGQVQWLVSTDGGGTWAPIVGATSKKLRLTTSVAMNNWEYEATVTNRAGSATSSPATLTVTPLIAPTVTANPTAVSLAVVGSTVNFSASATGLPQPTVTWYCSRDGGTTWSKTGPHASTLTVTVNSLKMTGYQYRASYTNVQGTVTTTAASLTVVASQLPRITTNPTSVAAYVGDSASFTVATSDPTATVQWRKSTDRGATWSTIGGATSTVLPLQLLPLSLNGLEVDAEVTNYVGSTISRAASLTVTTLPAPQLLQGPTNVSANEESSATFTVRFSGVRTTVTWWASVDNGVTYSAITGATSPILTLPSLTLAQSGELLEAVVTNASGSVTTAPAQLTVLALAPVAPSILQSPQNSLTFPNNQMEFSSAASGVPVATAQWSVSSNEGYSWTPLPGATSPNYSFIASALDNGKWYEVTYTNASGTATSAPAVLTVDNPAAQIDANWAGYVATGQTFTAVSGSWVVPTVNCATNTSTQTSQWVGIDGVGGTPTVEQVGTSTRCIYNGPFYEAWWEMYGDATAPDGAYYFDVPLPIATYPVVPGDEINASVTVTDGVWNMTITDVTQVWTYTKLVSGAVPMPSQSSAEWVVERSGITISGVASLGTLASTTPTTFTNASASSTSTTGAISAFTNQPWVVDSSVGQPWLTPGPLSGDGTSFTVVNTSPVS